MCRFVWASDKEVEMNVRYRIELSQAEREALTTMLSGGKHAARKLKRAQILLAADAGSSDDEIACTVAVGGSTVYRNKRRFVEGNLGRALWSRVLNIGVCRTRRFAGGWPKMTSSLGARTCGAFPMSMANTSPAWKMCSTSMPKRLIPSDRWSASTKAPPPPTAKVPQPTPAEPGQLERYDYEYRRNGSVNLFVVLDVHRPWRKVKVTERRAAEDYAQCMRELVDVHYPKAEDLRVVEDNLSTHSAGALYQMFPPAEARRILRRLEFHHTPKHASWLNMVEIEIGVLGGQCLDRRIDDPKRLGREITAWERRRNAARARIKWMFTTDNARAKMGRAYPATSKES